MSSKPSGGGFLLRAPVRVGGILESGFGNRGKIRVRRKSLVGGLEVMLW